MSEHKARVEVYCTKCGWRGSRTNQPSRVYVVSEPCPRCGLYSVDFYNSALKIPDREAQRTIERIRSAWRTRQQFARDSDDGKALASYAAWLKVNPIDMDIISHRGDKDWSWTLDIHDGTRSLMPTIGSPYTMKHLSRCKEDLYVMVVERGKFAIFPTGRKDAQPN